MNVLALIHSAPGALPLASDTPHTSEKRPSSRPQSRNQPNMDEIEIFESISIMPSPPHLSHDWDVTIEKTSLSEHIYVDKTLKQRGKRALEANDMPAAGKSSLLESLDDSYNCGVRPKLRKQSADELDKNDNTEFQSANTSLVTGTPLSMPSSTEEYIRQTQQMFETERARLVEKNDDILEPINDASNDSEDIFIEASETELNEDNEKGESDSNEGSQETLPPTPQPNKRIKTTMATRQSVVSDFFKKQ